MLIKGEKYYLKEKLVTFQNSSQLISQVIKSAGFTPRWQSIRKRINDLALTPPTVATFDDVIC